jgi:hypothetical protein
MKESPKESVRQAYALDNTSMIFFSTHSSCGIVHKVQTA